MELEIHVRHPKTALELLHDESYTADDVAQLLGVGVSVVRHAAFTGELRAQVRGHHILSLRREDVVAWFMTRDEPPRKAPA